MSYRQAGTEKNEFLTFVRTHPNENSAIDWIVIASNWLRLVQFPCWPIITTAKKIYLQFTTAQGSEATF
jgi:hypothetical protein